MGLSRVITSYLAYNIFRVYSYSTIYHRALYIYIYIYIIIQTGCFVVSQHIIYANLTAELPLFSA